jgi:sugar phosphate isomerase/epimerase
VFVPPYLPVIVPPFVPPLVATPLPGYTLPVISPPLCYGTNVHPAEDVKSILAMIEGPAAAVRAALDPGAPLGLGLWLPAAAARALAASAEAAADVRAALAANGLSIATVNAFPAGGFHGERVKERVYEPSWASPDRLDYTIDVGRALVRLLDPGTTCVASTVPGGRRDPRDGPAGGRILAEGLAAAARALADLHDASGVRVVLAPEPEPGCTLETAGEAIDFWRRDLAVALGRDADRLLPHLGLCVDLCHLAVVGDDPADALARLRRAGVPVAKVQVSAALEIASPASDPAAVEALRRFDEPRWLHQASGRSGLGVWRRAADLPDLFAREAEWRALAPWRVHFHAPLHLESVAGVGTTRGLVAPALRGVLAAGGTPPPLEVETYTWSAVPGFPGGTAELAAGIAAELRFARGILAAP